MTIDVCSEISSLGASPRLSFSYDLNQSDDLVPDDDQNHRSRSGDDYDDFDFCISKSFTQELPSADQLFSNGKIAPIQIKKVQETHNHHPKPNLHLHKPNNNQNASDDSKKKRLKEFLSISFDTEEEVLEKPFSKSFWKFKRSTSLNCDNGRSGGLIRSLHFLSRSYSTGSSQTLFQKDIQKKQSEEKQPSMASTKPPFSFSTTFYSYSYSKKKKKNCRSYGNGIRISPVLNIPPVFILKGTVSFFGLGSFFCNGKSKKKKR